MNDSTPTSPPTVQPVRDILDQLIDVAEADLWDITRNASETSRFDFNPVILEGSTLTDADLDVIARRLDDVIGRYRNEIDSLTEQHRELESRKVLEAGTATPSTGRLLDTRG